MFWRLAEMPVTWLLSIDFVYWQHVSAMLKKDGSVSTTG